MKGLMLHCGAQLKSRDEVFAVPLPKATDSYVPLPHQSLITRIEKQLVLEGVNIREQKFAFTREGQRLFGLMQVELPAAPDRDYGCVLGFRNSYDKSFSAGVCIGASVFVCDNLSFKGEVTFERKHTANLLRDLAWIISETVAKLPVLFTAQSETFEAYRRMKLEDREAHDLVIRFHDEGGLNASDIVPVLREWRAPRYPQFAEGGKTAWRLFNAATEIIKGDLWRLPARTQAIHEVLDAECGLNGTSADEDEEVVIVV
jgi:hypothetical protein